MKRVEWMLSLGLMLLALFAANAYAQSPREEFRQMVEQVQKNPSDNALREKIIKLAQELKPAPAVPDAAIEYEGRAQYAFRSAKSEADYVAAAKEYEKAITAAPWISGYYSDLCTIYEKAGKLDDAKRNCEFYLTSLSDPLQMADAKRRIAGLKYGMEQAAPPASSASDGKNALRLVLMQANGKQYIAKTENVGGNGMRIRFVFRVSADELRYGAVVGSDPSGNYKFGDFLQTFKVKPADFEFETPEKSFQCERGDLTKWCTAKVSISRDGQTIKITTPIEEYSQIFQLVQ